MHRIFVTVNTFKYRAGIPSDANSNAAVWILLSGEFWLGLEKMLSISKQRPHVLQIELSDWRGETQSVSYSFQLDGEESNYALHVQPTTPSNLESALTTGPDGLPFSTADRDQDLKEDANCALQLSGSLALQCSSFNTGPWQLLQQCP